MTEEILEGEILEELEGDEGEYMEEEGYAPPQNLWPTVSEQPIETVPIESSRGQVVEVPVGAPFVTTVERVAHDLHYGGFYRVFLNGRELLDPGQAPAIIEQGHRIALTAYDKVG
jgi:hypothetical protein